jgi:hypothetical protein
MKKVFYILSWIIIGLFLGLIILIGYWLLYPYKPIVFSNQPFPVEHIFYEPGDTLIYNVDYCKSTNINPTVTRYFVDGLVYMLSSNPASPKLKGCGKTAIQINIPSSLISGEYILKITYEYQMNPVRKVSVTAVTEKFKVVVKE